MCGFKIKTFSSPRASSWKAEYGICVHAESLNWSNSKDQDCELEMRFQLGELKTSSPQPWRCRVLLDQLDHNAVNPALNLGPWYWVEATSSLWHTVEEMSPRLSKQRESQRTDRGAMSKDGAACSFCLSQVWKRLFKYSFSHPGPRPAPYLLSPYRSPCTPASLFCWWASFLCPRSSAGGQGTPQPLSVSLFLSPPAPDPLGVPDSVLARLDGGTTAVRTSSPLSFFWLGAGGERGGTQVSACSPPAHLEPTAGQQGCSSLCHQMAVALPCKGNFFWGKGEKWRKLKKYVEAWRGCWKGGVVEQGSWGSHRLLFVSKALQSGWLPPAQGWLVAGPSLCLQKTHLRLVFHTMSNMLLWDQSWADLLQSLRTGSPAETFPKPWSHRSLLLPARPWLCPFGVAAPKPDPLGGVRARTPEAFRAGHLSPPHRGFP